MSRQRRDKQGFSTSFSIGRLFGLDVGLLHLLEHLLEFGPGDFLVRPVVDGDVIPAKRLVTGARQLTIDKLTRGGFRGKP
jgi:hypothetical protein